MIPKDKLQAKIHTKNGTVSVYDILVYLSRMTPMSILTLSLKMWGAGKNTQVPNILGQITVIVEKARDL